MNNTLEQQEIERLEYKTRRAKQIPNSDIYKWLLENGFAKQYNELDYDCVMRIHTLHYLFWSDNLKHFFIGVMNDCMKKGPAGTLKKWNSVIIPKPIYTIEQAKKLIEAITD